MTARILLTVDWLADGRDAAYQGISEPYDRSVVGLPWAARASPAQVAGKGSHTPVLILTARSSWAERIEGLKAGDD